MYHLLLFLALDGGRHSFFGKRKVCFNRERSHWNLPYKRRKLSDRGSIINYDKVHSSQSIKIPHINDGENSSVKVLPSPSAFKFSNKLSFLGLW